MKQKTRTKALSWLLSLALVLSLLPGMSLTAFAAGDSYIDGSGTSKTVDAGVSISYPLSTSHLACCVS